MVVLLHASYQKNAGNRFRTVFMIVSVCAYMIDLLENLTSKNILITSDLDSVM